MRSKSLPVSPTAYEKANSCLEVPNTPVDKAAVPKEVSKSKSAKSSFKGKVSSLLFSKNKKPSKEKTTPSPLESSQDGKQSSHIEQTRNLLEVKNPSVGKKNDESQCIPLGVLEEWQSLNREVPSCRTSSTIHGGPKLGNFPTKLMQLEYREVVNVRLKDEDQPSPISVLEAPFEDDANTSLSSENARLDHHRQPHLKPLVEPITHFLSWDDASSETASPQPSTPFITTSKAEEEERDRFMFVQTLLYAAGLDNERCETVVFRWHSPERPLDPALLHKCFLEKKDDEDRQLEGKCRQRRSNQRLLFDCINAFLLEIGGCMLNPNLWSRSWCSGSQKGVSSGALVAEEVWGKLRELFSEAKRVSGEIDGGLVVDRLVNEEVIGRGWSELMVSEINHIGREIEGEVFEELITEALAGINCEHH
ncbi:hypothetical protein QJS10_CPB18g01855 [Acorus calamus]|uniref:DUF4378 domain-containing protein n=1 Tax=Acorus calamus TaxID=4465 RepID=A0AAV9CN41_ACOCL|nr:hypothetical protein QJS10_CPB18g01855 [Acorus calamus]